MTKDRADDLEGLRDEIIAVLQKYDAAGIVQVTSQKSLRSFTHVETDWLAFKMNQENKSVRIELPEAMPKQQANELLGLSFEFIYKNICMLEETLVFNKRMLAHFLNQFGAEEAFWASKQFTQRKRTHDDPIN